MPATFWDSFEEILHDAEKDFLNYRFDSALEKWRQYYQITAKKEYKQIISEITQTWDSDIFSDIKSMSDLFSLFLEIRHKFFGKLISDYTFRLYRRFLVKKYVAEFKRAQSDIISLEHGVFEYLSTDYQEAIAILESYLVRQQDSVMARTYLGFAHMALKNQKAALIRLTENLFLAADKVNESELHLSQFRLLFGRLFSENGDKKVASWLLTFESWYRNFLVFSENQPFYILMQQKEANERIVQVKYYAHERYRHFIRCLFIAEYTRAFQKTKPGLIADQESYMKKLDPPLFERYRKKRKPPRNI